VGLIAAYLIYKQGDPVIGRGQACGAGLYDKGPEGSLLKLSDLRGNLVFLNVWATDCTLRSGNAGYGSHELPFRT
jgi:hypothetical protein